ncbi:hypothetical protein OBBRIDRAFT_803017 [Obba rivulosa]|uniref:Uncharacterized protein n=1 Tax=Obba rivulosa TaxID=1052685 RepID=A0A8E2B0V1_9APHY|nr:hypothetical protein OBBRIDRAFT_803017 [Obba rivulosa]
MSSGAMDHIWTIVAAPYAEAQTSGVSDVRSGPRAAAYARKAEEAPRSGAKGVKCPASNIDRRRVASPAARLSLAILAGGEQSGMDRQAMYARVFQADTSTQSVETVIAHQIEVFAVLAFFLGRASCRNVRRWRMWRHRRTTGGTVPGQEMRPNVTIRTHEIVGSCKLGGRSVHRSLLRPSAVRSGNKITAGQRQVPLRRRLCAQARSAAVASAARLITFITGGLHNPFREIRRAGLSCSSVGQPDTARGKVSPTQSVTVERNQRCGRRAASSSITKHNWSRRRQARRQAESSVNGKDAQTGAKQSVENWDLANLADDL